MQSRRTAYGYALRIDPGEEVVASLKSFAVTHGVRAAWISGLGALRDAELGFFDRTKRTYVVRSFAGDHEIGSLVGNLSELDGEPHPHCHITIAGNDFVAYTGHLFRAVVTLTCEVQLVTDPGILRRTRDAELGIARLDLEP